jgi:hypothetical protein
MLLQAQAAGGGGGGAGAAEGAAAAGGGSLDFLRNNTQFQALRQIVQANPQILQPMLQVQLLNIELLWLLWLLWLGTCIVWSLP